MYFSWTVLFKQMFINIIDIFFVLLYVFYRTLSQKPANTKRLKAEEDRP